MLTVVMLSVVTLSVAAPNIMRVSKLAPYF
jgi:hypothetical protein